MYTKHPKLMKVPTSRVANQDAYPAIRPEKGPKLWPVTEELSSRSNKKHLEWNHQDENAHWAYCGLVKYKYIYNALHIHIHFGTISRPWNDGFTQGSKTHFRGIPSSKRASPPKFARLWTSVGAAAAGNLWQLKGWKVSRPTTGGF